MKHFYFSWFIPLIEFVDEGFGSQADIVQRIVQLVRDSSSQIAHGCQFA